MFLPPIFIIKKLFMGVREHFGKVGWPNFAAVRLHIINFFAAYESLRSDMKILKV